MIGQKVVVCGWVGASTFTLVIFCYLTLIFSVQSIVSKISCNVSTQTRPQVRTVRAQKSLAFLKINDGSTVQEQRDVVLGITRPSFI